MNIRFFNRTYTIRRFGEQTVVRGYITAEYKDYTVSLHVYPTGSDSIQTLAEGERKITRLEAAGTDVLVASSTRDGIKGDLLYFDRDWYECVSAVRYDHTPLSHWKYSFVIVPTDAAGTTDTSNDVENSDTQSG